MGDFAGLRVKEAFSSLPDQEDEIFVVKDVFNVGPLRSEELAFSALRTSFWEQVPSVKHAQCDDLERLMQLSTRITNGEVSELKFWMSGIAADLCAYYWLLHFLKKHMGKLYVININGLPFLDDDAKLFYPESISALPNRQVIKALRLARPVSPAEWETDGDEWKRLLKEQDLGLRVSQGVKQLVSKPIDWYDKDLLSLLGNTNQKIQKVIGLALQKHRIQTGDAFLLWRLQEMALMNKVTLGKDNVKLFSGEDPVEANLFE